MITENANDLHAVVIKVKEYNEKRRIRLNTKTKLKTADTAASLRTDIIMVDHKASQMLRHDLIFLFTYSIEIFLRTWEKMLLLLLFKI